MTKFQQKTFVMPPHNSEGYDKVFGTPRGLDECLCGRYKRASDRECWICFDEKTLKEVSKV